MTKLGLKQIMVKSALVTGVAALAISACATSQTAAGAKITYKDGNKSQSMQPAARVAPRGMSPHSSMPQGQPSYSVPSPYVAPQALPQAMPQASSDFDASRIDPRLYPHQRVGKPYVILGKTFTPQHQPGYDVYGESSWYGDKYHGQPTASGELMDEHSYTAAHPTLPLQSIVHVTNLDNGQTLLVRINDRGPFTKNRVIDLSKASALKLGMRLESGIGRVRVRYAGPAAPLGERPNNYAAQAPLPAPVAAPDDYQPLREQAAPLPRAAAPQNTPYMQPQAPEALPPVNNGAEDDETVTLTIKGPIHMASASMPKSEFWHYAFKFGIMQ